MVSFCCRYNYGTVGHIGMQIFNFIVVSVIIAHRSVLTPCISKTHLPIVPLNVRELELNRCSKDQSRKKGGPLSWGEVGERGGLEAQLPPQSLKIY